MPILHITLRSHNTKTSNFNSQASKNAFFTPNFVYFQARLIDFGCATEVREEYNVFCGTGEYYPPEWYLTGRYQAGPLCVWQLGCLLYILLCGSIPFEKEDIPEASRDPKYEKHLSWEAADAIDQMLHPDPQKRVLLDKIFDLPFFKQS